MTEEKRRRPGAPAGNRNALKHGYYARKHPSQLSAELENRQFQQLEEEKQLIRFFLSRIIALGAQTQDLNQALALARVSSMAVTTLARIVRTEKFVEFLAEPAQSDELLAFMARLEGYIERQYGIPNAFSLTPSLGQQENNCSELNFIEASSFDNNSLAPSNSEIDDPNRQPPAAPLA